MTKYLLPIFAAVSALASLAHAAPVSLVLGTYTGAGLQAEEIEFNVNESLGRAWVKVEFDSINPVCRSSSRPGSHHRGACHTRTPREIAVAGLRYDSTTRQVLFEKDGAATVCAHVSGHDGVFTNRSIDLTGNCQLTSETGEYVNDDGIRVRTEPTVKILLNILYQ